MSGRNWDRLVLGLIMGSPSTKTDVTAEATRLMEKLGEANMDSSTPIASFVSHHLAMFLSHSAGKRDAVICLGDPDSDAVLLPILDYLPDTFRQILPYPAWSPVQANAAGDFSQVALLEFKDADLARYFVRDAYCNASWQTFDTLVNLIAEGGTIGLDDKLYSFFWSHGEFGNWQGISKFEGGQRVEEFKDLRANPRSLLESQFLRMRIQLARVNQALKKPAHPTESPPFPYSLLGFDPYDHSVLPERIIILGRASENRVMVDLLSSVLGAPVYRSAPSPVSPFFSGVECAITTSGLGACYKAAWTHSHLHNLTCSYDDFLRERIAQRTNRRKASRFDEGKSSVPIITRSIASLETQQDPAISSSQQLLPSIQSTRRLWNEISASSEVQSNESTSGMLLNPDTNGTEVDLIQIAEPDEDMFRRYGGQAEEYTRLESFVLRGIL
ncbi:hypothetical protein O181_011497 [Austropuccinia psidii MF-1]|uniref:Uncharacterized protein n=1 Tax=Austropuccinia psidii MF-1 TaxID=1389203 RepID=A0A9Q3BVU2_9BASI|nr:hypothetical protein [Austropuccinia psidii MF-1]